MRHAGRICGAVCLRKACAPSNADFGSSASRIARATSGKHCKRRSAVSPGTPASGNPPELMPKRVLFAGLFHETHTFLDGTTGLRDFAILRGDEMLRCA